MIATKSRLANMPFGEYWDTLPDIKTEGYLNPFKFKERMAAYKLLIECLNPHKALGTNHELNMFWGFVSQLDWQWRSGRLGDPKEAGKETSIKPDNISPDSWWGCCNYTLSIIPLVGAMQLGLVPPIEISLPKAAIQKKFARAGGASRPWIVPKAFEKPLEKWRVFFRAVTALKPADDQEKVRLLIWEAHLATITVATKLFEREFEMLSENERVFAQGWTRMVDFLGSAAWRTDLTYLSEVGRGNLPNRMLTKDDRFGAMMDMDAPTNMTILNVTNLGEQSKLRFRISRYLWARAMRTRAARDESGKLLAASFDSSAEAADDRKKLQQYMFAWRA
jgi:hypothetical protein